MLQLSKAHAALTPGWLPLDSRPPPPPHPGQGWKREARPSMKDKQCLSCSGQESMGLNKYLHVFINFLLHGFFVFFGLVSIAS